MVRNERQFPTRSQIIKREIQNSSEVIRVSNPASAGESVEKIVAAWTHLKRSVVGVCDKKSEVWTVNDRE